MKILRVSIIFFLLVGNTFCSQRMQRFVCNGEGKAQGLKFSVNYPKNWIISDGIRPHVYKLFDFEDTDGSINMAIYINLLDDAPTEEQINVVFQKDYVMGVYQVAKMIEFSNDAKIEDLRCLTFTAYLKRKVYDQEAYSIFKSNLLFFNRFHLQFNFAIFSNDQKYETAMKMYKKYNPIFKEMMYSLAINSRWE